VRGKVIGKNNYAEVIATNSCLTLMADNSGQSALEAFLCFVFFVFSFVGYVAVEAYLR